MGKCGCQNSWWGLCLKYHKNIKLLFNCFSTVLKKVELLRISKVIELLWESLLPCKNAINRAVGSSHECIRKKSTRSIQKNLDNIIWYGCYKSSRAGKCHTFLVSFIIPLPWSEWFRSCFVTRCKIFSNITHQTPLREGSV